MDWIIGLVYGLLLAVMLFSLVASKTGKWDKRWLFVPATCSFTTAIIATLETGGHMVAPATYTATLSEGLTISAPSCDVLRAVIESWNIEARVESFSCVEPAQTQWLALGWLALFVFYNIPTLVFAGLAWWTVRRSRKQNPATLAPATL